MSWPIRIVHWSFIALFILVPLAVLPITSELFEFNKLLLTYLLTLLITSAWLAQMLLEKRLIFRRTPLDLPLLLFLLALLFSTLFSLDPRSSILGYYGRWNGGLLSIFCYSLLYWACVSLLDQKFTRRLLSWPLLGTAGLISIYGLLQHFGLDAHIWVQDVQNRAFSTLGQPNWLAAYLVALIFLPLARILKSKTFSTLHYSLFALFFLVLLFTKSRSGLLALALTYPLFWLLPLKFRPPQLPTSPKTSFLVISGLLLLITLLTPNPARELIITPPAPPTTSGPALETGGTESGVIRQIVWAGALRVWTASPKTFWLGTGPETFALSYYQHRPLEHNSTSEWEFLYNKAHNEFLNTLATTGLVGTLAYLFLLSAMAFTFLRSLRPTPHLTSIALLSGWISLSITNFWGFSVVPTQLLLFLLPALAATLLQDSPKLPPPPHPSSPQILTLTATCLLTLWLSFSLARYWLADYHYAASLKSLTAFSSTSNPAYLVSAYQAASQALDLNPSEPVINLQLAESAAYLSLYTTDTDATASAQLAQLAAAAAASTLSHHPYHPVYYKAVSRTYILLSALDNNYLELAAFVLGRAADLSPTDPRIPYNQAIIAKYRHQPQAAQTFLDHALKLKPDFPISTEQLDGFSTPSASP